jgi:hypothetical protein
MGSPLVMFFFDLTHSCKAWKWNGNSHRTYDDVFILHYYWIHVPLISDHVLLDVHMGLLARNDSLFEPFLLGEMGYTMQSNCLGVYCLLSVHFLPCESSIRCGCSNLQEESN